MPAANVKVIDPTEYRLRHIGPAADLYPSGGAPSATTVLATTLVPRWLPRDTNPESRDFSVGQWTGRLGDAGEFSITFPNATASDGIAWSQRFKTDGHRQFVEIYSNDDLEFVGLVLKVDAQRATVTVTGQDGWFLLRKAYEADFYGVLAPRDFIERYTFAPVVPLASNFPGSTLDAAKWTSLSFALNAAGIVETVSVANQEAVLSINADACNAALGPQAAVGLLSVPATIVNFNDRWRVDVVFEILTQNNLAAAQAHIEFGVQIGGNRLPEFQTFNASPGPYGKTVSVHLGKTWNASAQPNTPYAYFATSVANATIDDALFLQVTGGTSVFDQKGLHTLTVESVDGRWARALIDGRLLGYLALPTTGTITGGAIKVVPFFAIDKTTGGVGVVCNASAGIRSVAVRTYTPFLARGATGDYALPGVAGTYPTGGLRGRYFNDLKFSDPTQLKYKLHILAPDATPYAERLDATINNPANPQPGADVLYYSARWEGAVWIPASTISGTWTFTISNLDDGARLWVGKTRFGDQVVDDWNNGAARTINASVTSASLGGRDAWYPIVLEYYQFASTRGCVLSFTPPGAGTYVDAGGTTITRGGSVVIPSTSLSPLGCVDQRSQGLSFFDLVQKTGKDFGYQLSVEPKSLESGEFPGRLVPRLRAGRDTDVILEPDDSPRVEPIMDYQSILDATDQAASVRGNGAGLPDGKSGQMQVEVFDPTTMMSGLFGLESWQDASELAFLSLLAGRLNAELGLRLTPWQQVTGAPRGTKGLVDTFPLTGTYSAMKWVPGDGVRLRLRDVAVDDAIPRQMIQVTRQFVPAGRTATQAQFRSRPKSTEAALRQQIYATTRSNRTFQHQYVELSGNFVSGSVAAAGGSGLSLVFINAETVVKATLRVSVNPATGGTLTINMNGVGVFGTVAGTAGFAPIELDVTRWAVPAGAAAGALDGRTWASVTNGTGSALNIDLQLFVTVLR